MRKFIKEMNNNPWSYIIYAGLIGFISFIILNNDVINAWPVLLILIMTFIVMTVKTYQSSRKL